MKNIISKYHNLLDKLTDLPLLIFRVVLVYGFYSPALYKISDFSGTASWFESLGVPFPTLNAYMAGITEFAGVILLTLGLGTRLISFPLIITMIVAIFTVHIGNGFPAIHNGIEIPLYFIFMLLTLMVYGPGKLSIDYLIQRRKK
mgnify:CR=1 FL=1